MAKRSLTDRQVAALAALERLGGEATLPDLHAECPMGRTPSMTLRVLEQLIKKERVTWRGRWAWVYLGVPPGDFRHDVADEEVVRFRIATSTN